MGLSLVLGPAHVGKVALLLERYLDVLAREPWLVVPNRIDVDRVERDLVRRRPALLAGTVGTFDDLFRHLFELLVAYRNELAALGLHDRDGMRRVAVERLRGDLGAWSGSPVFAYGF